MIRIAHLLRYISYVFIPEISIPRSVPELVGFNLLIR